jgi:hypothetical protein
MTIASRQAATMAAFFVAMTSVAPVSSAPSLAWMVDCTRGQSISRALEHAPPGFKLTVTVRGTCNEFVLIDRDDLTLQGDPVRGATVMAPDPTKFAMDIRAGRRIVIDRLTVIGGLSGIHMNGTADTEVTNCVIQDAVQNGVSVVAGDVRLFDNTIQNSGAHGVALNQSGALLNGNRITSNHAAGVHIEGRSAVRSIGNAIASNGSNGVEVNLASQATIINNTITSNGTNPAMPGNGVSVGGSNADISDNSIANNRQAGVSAAGSVISVSNNKITGNADGVIAYLASQFAMSGNGISYNKGTGVMLNANSTGQISGAGIQVNAGDGILVQWGSKLILLEPPSTSGGNGGYGLRCMDAESSVVGLQLLIGAPPNNQGDVSPTCTGF